LNYRLHNNDLDDEELLDELEDELEELEDELDEEELHGSKRQDTYDIMK
jgi:hypothetical protein